MYINNKQLQEKKKVQKHAWRFEDGSDVEMSWNLYMPGVGNAVVMQTGASYASANVPLPLSPGISTVMCQWPHLQSAKGGLAKGTAYTAS